MKRIYLTKQEKQLLQGIARFGFDTFASRNPNLRYKTPLRALEGKDLVYVRRVEGGGVVDARVSEYGMEYLSDNPTLRNPTPWRDVAQWAAVALSAGAIAASLFACARAGLL